MNSNRKTNPGRLDRRLIAAILVSFGFFLISMVCVLVLAIVSGIIDRRDDRWLEKWIPIQLGAGFLFAGLSGYICRRVAGHFRASLYYMFSILILGLIESFEIMRYLPESETDNIRWGILSAPVVTALGILFGAWRPGNLNIASSAVFRLALPLVVLATASLLAMFVLPQLEEAEIFSAALTFDFTLVVPALVYIFAVRPGKLPVIALVPVFVAGYALAHLTIPDQHHGILDWIRFVIIPAEATLVVYLVAAARRSLKNVSERGDFVTHFRVIATDVLKRRVPADIFTTEVSLFYHAFRKPRKKIAGGYTVHRQVGYAAIAACLMLVILVETLAIHFLVAQWNTIIAWLLTGLSIYFFVWLLGDCRALMSRLTCFSDNRLQFRFGLRWEADIRLSNIATVETVVSSKDLPFVITLSGNPNILLLFHEPVEFVGLYGIRKKATSLAVRLDDPVAFCNEIKKRSNP